uniref:Putative homing endonuclease n=1 Tax=viral metagenome TaxID=1070528 RepID=A0A6M3KJF9_9ZZZZ
MDELNKKFNFNKVGYTVLTKGKIAYYDLEDFYLIRKHRWSCEYNGKNFYAHRKDLFNKTIRMHNEILPALPGLVVDHKNGNTLDNRKVNLRCVPRSVNALNSRRYKGYEENPKGKFFVRIRLKSLGKDYCSKVFNSKNAALRHYKIKKKEIVESILKLKKREVCHG